MLDISNFPWAECAITENRVMYQTDSLSLKRSKRNTGIMRYEFELITIDMDMSVGRGVKAKLSGAVDDTLLFIHPRLSYTLGDIPAEGIKIKVASIAGSKSIEVSSGIPPWQLLAGDYIQFSNDTKVYEVAKDTFFASGQQTVELTSPLRKATVLDSNITVDDVTWHLVSNGVIESSMVASENQDIELTLVAVEKL